MACQDDPEKGGREGKSEQHSTEIKWKHNIIWTTKSV